MGGSQGVPWVDTLMSLHLANLPCEPTTTMASVRQGMPVSPPDSLRRKDRALVRLGGACKQEPSPHQMGCSPEGKDYVTPQGRGRASLCLFLAQLEPRPTPGFMLSPQVLWLGGRQPGTVLGGARPWLQRALKQLARGRGRCCSGQWGGGLSPTGWCRPQGQGWGWTPSQGRGL